MLFDCDNVNYVLCWPVRPVPQIDGGKKFADADAGLPTVSWSPAVPQSPSFCDISDE